MTAGTTSIPPEAPAREVCDALAAAVELYETTDPLTLRWVLLALTVAAVANAGLSFVACLLPRRHVARSVILTLLVLPVLILVPFLVLSGRRDAMRLSRFGGVRDRRSLGALALACDQIGHPAPELLPNTKYDFHRGRGHGAWQTYVVLLFAGATAALGARISLALAAGALGSAPSAVVGRVETHTAAEVHALLTRLRWVGQPHHPQCAICLEDMGAPDELSRLECGHVFHEVCFEKWVNTAMDAKCPMCKAPVWCKNDGQDGATRRVSWEGTRESPQNSFEIDIEAVALTTNPDVDSESQVLTANATTQENIQSDEMV